MFYKFIFESSDKIYCDVFYKVHLVFFFFHLNSIQTLISFPYPSDGENPGSPRHSHRQGQEQTRTAG